MIFLTEEVKETIRLTSHQKSIIATITQSGGTAADDIIASNSNLSGALDQMVKMQMVINSKKDEYAVTDLGKKYAKEANILDDSGELTDEGLEMVIGGNKTNESVGTLKDYLELI